MKKSILISFILGLLYAIYILFYFFGAINTTSGTEQAAAGIATSIVMPHMVCVILAVIFNGLGLFQRRRGFVLTGAILYALAMVLFIPYFMFVIVEMILSFVGYVKMK